MMVARRAPGRRTQTSNEGNRGRCGEVARQTLWGVGTEKLNPRVVMVKSAQDGVRTYETGSLNRPRHRRIFV